MSLIGGYEAAQGVCDNTFGWKSVGQELRPNVLTTDLTPFQHGNRALASKDMKKSQGKLRQTSSILQYHLVKTALTEVFFRFSQIYSHIQAVLTDHSHLFVS